MCYIAWMNECLFVQIVEFWRGNNLYNDVADGGAISVAYFLLVHCQAHQEEHQYPLFVGQFDGTDMKLDWNLNRNNQINDTHSHLIQHNENSLNG